VVFFIDRTLLLNLKQTDTFSNYNRSGLYYFLNNYIIISSSHKFLYIKTPKNACTKVLEVLIKGVAPNESIDYSTIHRIWYKNVERKIKPHSDLTNLIKDNEYYKFCIVRNPYTRILSAWKNKIVDTKADHIKNYKKKLGLFTKDISFQDFVKTLKNNKMHNIHADLHFTNQYNTLLYNIIPYDFIGRFENLQHDLSHVITKTHLPSNLVNTLNEKVNPTSNHDLERYYTSQIQSDVYDLYKIDFETFGYSKDLPL